MNSRRVLATLVAVLALAGTSLGIALAATDPNPAGKDLLSLNGYPPKSADVSFAISSSGTATVTGHAIVNFNRGTMTGYLDVPVAFLNARVDMRVGGGNLYLRADVAGTSNTRWTALHLGQLNLQGLARELVHPELRLLSGQTELPSTTTNGAYVTHHYRQTSGGSSLGGLSLGKQSQMDLAITLGSERQIAGLGLDVTSSKMALHVTMTMNAYNVPANFAMPSASDVTTLNMNALGALLSGGSIQSLLKAVPSATQGA